MGDSLAWDKLKPWPGELVTPTPSSARAPKFGSDAVRERPSRVSRPLLPQARDIFKYLELADHNRWYTNRGCLVVLLEQRLAELIGQESWTVMTTASGTAALEAAILATVGCADADRPLALMPSYTFTATAVAAERCGYKPYFIDIDPENWVVDLEVIALHPRLKEVGVVVAVAPYGRLPDTNALKVLQARTGIQIVVDAAAAFEQVIDHPECISHAIPLTVSFHATKTFSTGEGGAVFWRDLPGQAKIAQSVNFGMLGSRESSAPGFNGRMSEYHAAVGLAMLDQLADRRQSYASVSNAFLRAAETRGLAAQVLVSPDVSSAYALFVAANHTDARRTQTALTAASVDWRQWYEEGLHTQSHFAGCEHDPLPVTSEVSPRVIGLPMAIDMASDEINDVLDVIAQACS